MIVSENGIKLLHGYEGCRLKAYLPTPNDRWTIGYGVTFYPNGQPVKQGDIITQEQADELFKELLPKYGRKVLARVARPLLQHEFDAAVSFCYNAGTGYKKPNGQYVDFNIWKNIEDKLPGMKDYWENLAVTQSGIKLKGLQRRRKSEVHLYLTGEVNFFNT